jgi:ubiquinone biosynthesis protein
VARANLGATRGRGAVEVAPLMACSTTMVGLVRTYRTGERLAQISLVLAKHGFGEIVSRLRIGGPPKQEGPATDPLAIRLRRVLEDLGPTFVKLGQIASTRPDVLPESLIVELKKLQESVPPMSADEVDEVLDEMWGEHLDDVFVEFEKKPLAAASIGQVHTAKLKPTTPDGVPRDVVVKLQRPGARTQIERDVDLLYMLARLLEQNIPEARVYSPVGLVGEFDRAVTAELDYGQEADNALRFARNFAEVPTVRFPVPYKDSSGKRGLVMERFFGGRIDRIADPAVRKKVARDALQIVAKMVFEDGFFHADPHPGNIILLGPLVGPEAAPVIGLIDLGLVGRLNEEMRDGAIRLLIAAATNDARAVADALLAMGKPRGRVDVKAFRAEVEVLAEKYLGRPLKEIEVANLIGDLVKGAVKYEIDMPVEIMMVGKALMTIEGIGKQLDPDLDVLGELKPMLMKVVAQRYSPERLARDGLRAARALGDAALALPGQVTDILDDTRAGRLSVVARDPDMAAATDRLGRRLFTAIISASLIGAATALVAVQRAETLATVMYCTAVALVLLHWFRDRRQKKT